MTQTLRTSRRVYQLGSDMALSNPLPRLTGTGTILVNTEANRMRIYDTGAFVATADILGRLVTVRNTPDSATSSAGTNLHDNWTFRIRAVDPAGDFIDIEGHRWEEAGTCDYVIHASIDASSASAAFAIDEGPLGPNSAPYPAVRTNSGPTMYQAIYFPRSTDQVLASSPWMISDLGPNAGSTATTCRLSDTFDRYGDLTAQDGASGLEWRLRDMPAYTIHQFFFIMHRFLQQCGWSLYQHRGKNNGVGAGRFIVEDAIYRSFGEAGNTQADLRVIIGNLGSSTGGGASAGSTAEHGFDFAMFGAWDRNFVNPTGVNKGNGINAVSAHINTTNMWAAAADTANSTANQACYWSPEIPSGSAIPGLYEMSHEFHGVTAKAYRVENSFGTPEGGEVVELNYTMIGDADEVHLFIELSGFGACYIGFGLLEPRPDQNTQIHSTNFSVSIGQTLLRLGGRPGLPLDNGIDPSDPTNTGDTDPPLRVGDKVQICGLGVNAGITPDSLHSGEFIETVSVVSFPGILNAIGRITALAGSSTGDGDTLIISDGVTTATFEFDLNGGGVSVGNVPVVFTALDTPATIASALAAAINGSALDITATPVSSDVNLVNDGNAGAGGVGNVAIVPSGTIVSNNIPIEGMSGGGYGLTVSPLQGNFRAGALVGEDPQPIFIYRAPHLAAGTSSIFDVAGGFRTNNRVENNNATYRDGAVPQGGSTDGLLGFNCLASLQTVSQFSELNPNARGGRFTLVPVSCRDQAGGQLRGQMKYLRHVSARVGTYKFLRDRSTDAYHFVVPFVFRQGSESEASEQPFATCFAFGPVVGAHALP